MAIILCPLQTLYLNVFTTYAPPMGIGLKEILKQALWNEYPISLSTLGWTISKINILFLSLKSLLAVSGRLTPKRLHHLAFNGSQYSSKWPLNKPPEVPSPHVSPARHQKGWTAQMHWVSGWDGKLHPGGGRGTAGGISMTPWPLLHPASTGPAPTGKEHHQRWTQGWDVFGSLASPAQSWEAAGLSATGAHFRGWQTRFRNLASAFHPTPQMCSPGRTNRGTKLKCFKKNILHIGRSPFLYCTAPERELPGVAAWGLPHPRPPPGDTRPGTRHGVRGAGMTSVMSLKNFTCRNI